MPLWFLLDRMVGSVTGLSLLDALETCPKFAWASSEDTSVCWSRPAALGVWLQEGLGCQGPGTWGGPGRSWFLGPELWGKKQVSSAGTHSRPALQPLLKSRVWGPSRHGRVAHFVTQSTETGVWGGWLAEE